MNSNYKAGFVGLLGLPNAGKSTLLNLMIDEKIAGVSSKPQTTRQRIVGIHSDDQGQCIFLDAPGWVRGDNPLNSFLEREFESVIKDSDVLLVHFNIDEEKKNRLEKLKAIAEEQHKPWIGLVTKRDLPGLEHRTARLLFELEESSAKKVLSISSLADPKETKLQVLEAVYEFLPESPAPLYDPELFTTHSLKEITAEIIREKCFENLHHELPYAIAIRINLFEEKPQITRIFAEILVEKENHKRMVVGEKGSMIREIGTQARKDIARFVETKIFLDLKVSFRDNWSNNKRIMEELGYAIPESK